jgi:sulfite reductase alpha subunit-like flavoprotein
MTENTRITEESYDRDARHYVFDLEGKGMDYEVGDVLSLHAHNAPDRVANFLNEIKLNPNEVVDINKLTEDNLFNYPTPLSWQRVFTEILDVMGKPSRRFYDFLGTCATDEKEKTELKHLISKEGKEDFKGYLGESVTYADLLTRFPSALPQLGIIKIILIILIFFFRILTRINPSN